MSQFTETRKLFQESISAKPPYDYSTWCAIPEDLKSIALFINFFDKITLAFYKAKAAFVEEEDAISILCQHLQKNVDKIKADKSRYNAAYIYTVAHNCILSLARINRDINRYKYEMSNISETSEGEVNLFDTYISTSESADPTFDSVLSSEFWAAVGEDDADTVSVINILLGGSDISTVSDKVKSKDWKSTNTYLGRTISELRDRHRVSKSDRELIKNRLRSILASL